MSLCAGNGEESNVCHIIVLEGLPVALCSANKGVNGEKLGSGKCYLFLFEMKVLLNSSQSLLDTLHSLLLFKIASCRSGWP